MLSLILTTLFMNGEVLGIRQADRVMGYEQKLFDTSAVHTIDIIMDDWDSFIETCENEEYAACAAVIDGEAYKNIGIRAKGNTSLSSVSSMDSDRYSFKIEFDQYDSTKSYYGLDKLSLNNIIQDNTFMKDFLVYEMMRKAGADAPLCSYVYITVNGEDWGLYLAVEGVEESFLQRNYGSDYGELYKPDSLSFGGGRGNGKDFDIDDLDFESLQQEIEEKVESGELELPEGFDLSEMPDMSEMQQSGFPFGGGRGQMGGMPDQNGSADSAKAPEIPAEGAAPEVPEMNDQSDTAKMSGMSTMPDTGNMGGKGGFDGGGMGSSDVKLQYIDDDPESYSNIFDSAKTDISDADKKRLITSLKSLSDQEDLEDVLDIDAVIRYFVVHNFVVNGDSYTGSMIHNYYLYEEDGRLSMLPWDYNLAFGTFQGGSNAVSAVNDPIDSPVSGGMDDRPMISWIFSDESYTEMYHEYFSQFIESAFDSGWFAELIDSTAEMIAPYVEKDPSKFCTYEEFESGVETLREFCLLRAESVRGQLEGTIPSTSEGQTADSSTLIDASSLTLSDMGTMNNGMGGGNRGEMDGFGANRNERSGNRGDQSSAPPSNDASEENAAKDSFDTLTSSEAGDAPAVPDGNNPVSVPGDSVSQTNENSSAQGSIQTPPQSIGQTNGTPPTQSNTPEDMKQMPSDNADISDGKATSTSAESSQLPFGQTEIPESDRSVPNEDREMAFDESDTAVNEDDVPSEPEQSEQDVEANAAESAAGLESQEKVSELSPEPQNGSMQRPDSAAIGTTADSNRDWLLIGISALVLIGGLLIVSLYRKRS